MKLSLYDNAWMRNRYILRDTEEFLFSVIPIDIMEYRATETMLQFHQQLSPASGATQKHSKNMDGMAGRLCRAKLMLDHLINSRPATTDEAQRNLDQAPTNQTRVTPAFISQGSSLYIHIRTSIKPKVELYIPNVYRSSSI